MSELNSHTDTAHPQVEVFHNILWSKYKGGVFGALYRKALDVGLQVHFIQIAETERSRVSLGSVDLSYHKYPYDLLFGGAYEDVRRPQMYWRTFWRVFKSKADLVVLPCYDKVEYWVMLSAAILRGKRRAVFCDSTVRDRRQTWLKSVYKRLFFFWCHGFFGYGRRSAEYLQMHGVPAARIFTRCQAAALPHDYQPDKALVKRMRNWPSEKKPRFLYVGRLAPEKRLDTLLQTLPIVLSDYPNAEIVFVGSGPMKTDLRQCADSLGIGSAVLWLGSMDGAALEEQYAKATCLVLPSESEPWGLVVNEALSYGCPVVVSNDCGCVPELVIDGITGYSFRTGDCRDLADKLIMSIRVFSHNDEGARRCIKHMQHFTPETAGQQLLLGCRKLLAT